MMLQEIITLPILLWMSIICNPGLTNCDGVCVDLQTDINHCGTCDHPCPVIPNRAPSCDHGICGIASCDNGLSLCGGQCICNAYQHCDDVCVCNDVANDPCVQRTIDFSDLEAGELVPNCYQSFDWTNFFTSAGGVVVQNGEGTISRDTPFTISVNIIVNSGSMVTIIFSNGDKITSSGPFTVTLNDVIISSISVSVKGDVRLYNIMVCA